MNYKKIILVWIGGFFIALISFCLLCLVFYNSIEPNEYVSDINRLIPKSGLSHRDRKEGWGNTKYGKYGVNGIEDITKVEGDKVLLWGDSYVEGLSVNDSEKTPLQFNKIWQEKNKKSFTCAGIGASGTHLADYAHYAPIYEKIIPDIKAHVIFLHSDMVRFNEDKQGGVLDFQNNDISFRFIPPNGKISPTKNKLILVLRSLGLDFVWWIYNDLRTYKWRFNLGRSGAANTTAWKQYRQPIIMPDKKWNIDGYDFLIKKFKGATNKEIVFIYVPHVPYIFDNKILLKDRSRKFITKIKEKCNKNGIVFLNMEEDFKNYYTRTGKSPRGFANSRPFMGHFNSAGHKLVAKKLVEYFEGGK